MNWTQNKIVFFGLRNQQGQSAVEYLVITAALVASLLTLPNMYDTLSHTMRNKYQSYAFGVSISDPPSKAFDDKVSKDADEVKHILETLKQVENLFSHTIIPDIKHGKMPSTKSITEFRDQLKKLF